MPVICALVCAVAGALIYAFLAFGLVMPQPYPAFGTDIYNAYFYQLLDGRFDLPLRMLRLEGHYSADGTGILYHGIAPLLTRLLLHPFVTIHTFPTAAFSVWIWSVVGPGFYHLALFQVLRKYAGQVSFIWALLMGLAIWICSPGLLLSANPVLYHEPISIAYAAMAIASYLMVRCALFGLAWRYVVIATAILAGILLHARPHLAVGLYAGTVLMILFALWRDKMRALAPALLSLGILGVIGLSFLQLNAARFGSATSAHGSIETPGALNPVQFGPTFFYPDGSTTGRWTVFAEHGRFHLWRVLPNALVYTLDFPGGRQEIAALHRKVTESISGYGIIEPHRFGMLSFWTGWIVLMVIGLSKSRPRLSGGVRAVPLLISTGIAGALMLSYPTVAFRYRHDVWPFVMTLCLLSLPGLMQRYGAGILQQRRVFSLSFLAVLHGVLISAFLVSAVKLSFREKPGELYGPWDFETCLTRLAHKDFSTARMEQLCIDPESVFADRGEG